MINLSRECSTRKPPSEVEKAIDEVSEIANQIDDKELWHLERNDEDDKQSPEARRIKLLQIAVALEQAVAIREAGERIAAALARAGDDQTVYTAKLGIAIASATTRAGNSIAGAIADLEEAMIGRDPRTPTPAPRPPAPSPGQQATKAKDGGADTRPLSPEELLP